jgi:hypothetical protein
VLVRPDRRDRSDGTLWGELHRVSRNRITHPTREGGPVEGTALQNGLARAEVP